MANLGEDLYSGAAAYGKFQAGLGLVLGTIIGIIMVIVGISLANRAVSLTGKSEAILSDVVCNQIGTRSNDSKNVENVYDCQFNIKYKVNDIEYTKHILTHNSVQHYNSESLTIYYNPDHPDDAQLNSDDTYALGYVLVAGGIVLVLGSWLWFYIATRFKFAAAAGAVRSIF